MTGVHFSGRAGISRPGTEATLRWPLLSHFNPQTGAPPITGRCVATIQPEAAAAVGNPPVLRVTEPFTDGDRGFWAKLEGLNPGGIKDSPAMHMVARARARGDLRRGARIIQSSSGTLGLGLALAAKVYGYRSPSSATPGSSRLSPGCCRPTAFGSNRSGHRTPRGAGNRRRCDRVAQLLAGDPDAWHPDQYNNPDNVDSYGGLALELNAQLGRVDVLVCSVGTGGHSSGVSRALRALNPALELIRGGHGGVDHFRATGRVPADARIGLEHPAGQRRLPSLH